MEQITHGMIPGVRSDLIELMSHRYPYLLKDLLYGTTNLEKGLVVLNAAL